MDGISRQGVGSMHLSDNDCITNEVALFEKRDKEIALVDGEDISFRPALLNKGPMEFMIGGNASRYLMLSTARLYVKVKFLKDGKPIDPAGADKNLSVCNLPGPSLFQTFEVSVAGAPVTDLRTDLAQYKRYFETILSYGKDPASTHMETMGFHMDTAGGFDQMIPDEANKVKNEGFVARGQRIKDSKTHEVDYMFNIGQDFFQVGRLVPGKIPLKLKLTRTEDSFVIMAPTASSTFKYQIEITDAQLFVRAVTINPMLSKLMEDKWREGASLQYPISRTVIKPFTVLQGQKSKILPQMFEGPIPKTIIIGQVLDAAFNGSIDTNPYNFQHFKTNKMYLKVNGATKPSDPYTPDFPNDFIMREYSDLFAHTGIHHDNLGNCITRNLFKNGCYLQAFDLSPNADNGFQLHELGTGNVDLHIEWEEALDKNITILAYASYDATIEIDKDNKVKLVYDGTGEERFEKKK